jgi:predicted RNase H-like nuclease (RuvC/YqgF family)
MDARVRIWRNGAAVASLALLTLALTSIPCSAQQPQDSDPVAEAARKAREQKKKDAAKPKKVYTDDDVNHLASGGVPTDAKASNATEEGAKNADAQSKDKGSPEESPEMKWRKQFKDAYANLDRAQRELDILQREDNKAQLQYYNDPQKALAEQYTRKEINDKDAKIAAKKKEIDDLKQKISDMEDALCKSGGDPGWATP